MGIYNKEGLKGDKMRKNGFTLIELLAVIVILAIIAVIAVPIVINIIDETKQNATLRSAEMYMDAVEISIAYRVMHHGGIDDDAYPIMSDGDICLGIYDTTATPKKCAGNPIDSNNNKVLKIEVKGEKPTSGQIIIKDGQIEKEYNAPEKTWLEISGKRIEPIEENGEVKFGIVSAENSKEETIEVGKMSICKPLNVQTEGTYTPGDKYECDVDPNKEGYDYTFYVLNSTSTEVNLIMDRNMCSDGTPTAEGKTCLVAWNSSGSNADGPVAAMDYLYNATKDWANISDIEMNYTDEGNRYGTIVTTNNITKMTKKDGTAITVLTDQEGYSNLKARLPYYSEVGNSNGTNEYLYENLHASEWYGMEGKQPTINMSGIDGYWTLSSDAGSSDLAGYVNSYGGAGANLVDIVVYGDLIGVRAVINLKI